MIVNGGFEDGITYPWHHRDKGYIRLLSGAGRDGSTALISKRADYNDGVGLNFDTRCLHVYGGRFYEIKAWIRLQLHGTYSMLRAIPIAALNRHGVQPGHSKSYHSSTRQSDIT
jgi:hypothetical protein